MPMIPSDSIEFPALLGRNLRIRKLRKSNRHAEDDLAPSALVEHFPKWLRCLGMRIVLLLVPDQAVLMLA
jgi:hypothetical protein